jgi:hypothetical protein
VKMRFKVQGCWVLQNSSRDEMSIWEAVNRESLDVLLVTGMHAKAMGYNSSKHRSTFPSHSSKGLT